MSSSYHTGSRESWRQHSICKTGSISWQERLADLLTHRLIFTDKLTHAQTQKHTNRRNLIHHYNGVTPFSHHTSIISDFFFLRHPNPSPFFCLLWIFHIYGVCCQRLALIYCFFFLCLSFCLSIFLLYPIFMSCPHWYLNQSSLFFLNYSPCCFCPSSISSVSINKLCNLFTEF